METTGTIYPSERQILVNLGNRYVVFGRPADRPEKLNFDPETDSAILPSVPDESEGAEERIALTLRIPGFRRSNATPEASDIEIMDDDGNLFHIDVKVRERDPRQKEYLKGFERIEAASKSGDNLQLWHLNIDRLKLFIMHIDKTRPRPPKIVIDELTPIDVWERTEHGVFRRAKVVEEVDDWLKRVLAFYDQVRYWLSDRTDLRFDQSRTVIMSEELMQKYAVPDQPVPVLDVLAGDQVMASFVPRGLRLTDAADGRIDMITPAETITLRATGKGDKLEWWRPASWTRPQSTQLDRDELRKLIP